MLGFATVDHQQWDSVVTVWLTSRVTATTAVHTNAVVIDPDAESNALQKIHALTRDRIVVMTDGSTPDGLPIDANTMTLKYVSSIVSETVERQRRIVEEIDAYAEKTGNPSLVRPVFRDPVSLETFAVSDASATGRALQTANYIARVWNRWLKTDAERLSRTQHPQTKATPWIMPEELNIRGIEELPVDLTERFRPQPMEAYGA